MGKVDVAYVYNGIFLSHKKEGNPAICNNMLHPCCNMDGSWGHYAKWDVREEKTNTVWYHLHVNLKQSNS